MIKKAARNEQITAAQAEIFKALGHPTRLTIVQALARKPCCVCDIMELVPGAQPTTSRHLDILRQAGVVRRHRDGTRMIYELALPCLLRAMPCVTEALRARIAARKSGA
jgi:ArsR family transcriptional regulator